MRLNYGSVPAYFTERKCPGFAGYIGSSTVTVTNRRLLVSSEDKLMEVQRENIRKTYIMLDGIVIAASGRYNNIVIRTHKNLGLAGAIGYCVDNVHWNTD